MAEALPATGSSEKGPPAVRHGLRLHLFLFVLCCVTTTLSIGLWSFDPALPWAEAIWVVLSNGGMYSATLMTILLAHEMGHYFCARRHRVEVSLPYFLPGPPFISFGTFGAFIRMERSVKEPKALIDIGLGGPLAGLAVAIPALLLGLSLSEIEPLELLRGGLFEGNSLLYLGLKWLALGPIPKGHDVSLHPMAFAGWMGLLVTSLNLFPVGQLDGGHIAYALLGPSKGRYLARAVFGGLIGLAIGLVFFEAQFMWVIWAGLIAFIGVEHPPLGPDAARPLDRTRKGLGYLSLALFGLTFTPIPISDTPSGGWEEVSDVPQVPGVRGPGPALPSSNRRDSGAPGAGPDEQSARERDAGPGARDASRSRDTGAAGARNRAGSGSSRANRGGAPASAGGRRSRGRKAGSRGVPEPYGDTLPRMRHLPASDRAGRAPPLADPHGGPRALGSIAAKL